MKKKNQNHSIKSQFFTAHILLVLISTISFFVLSSVFLYAQNVKNVEQNISHTGELSALHTNSFFYCAVNDKGERFIALATSKEL